jgi:hypothetical protein
MALEAREPQVIENNSKRKLKVRKCTGLRPGSGGLISVRFVHLGCSQHLVASSCGL